MRRLLLGCGIFLVACGPGFTPFREVEKSRVIGASVTVDADPTLVTPAPGDAATLRLVVADPGPKVGRTFTMLVCTPSESRLDIVFCDSTTTLVAVALSSTLPGPTDPKPDPEIRFTVPDAASLGDADELWFMGAVCNGGTVRDLVTDGPVFGEPWEPCLDDPTAIERPYGQLLTTRIQLHRAPNDLNHRPDFETLTFDGVPFTAVPPDDAPVTGCVGAGFPEIVADDAPHLLEATVAASARETFIPDGLTETFPEDIFLFMFRTAGTLDRSFGTIDDDTTVATLEYTPPPAAEVDPTGTLVRTWLQIKDERDGVTWAHRGICVVPPAP